MIRPLIIRAGEAFNRLPANIRGAMWVILSAFLLTAMGAMVKEMARDIHSFQIVFFRCLFGALTLAPFIVRAGMGALKTGRPFLLLARTLVGTLGMFCVFYSFQHMPLAEAVAIIFSRPLFAVALAIPFLGEVVGWRRAIAAVVGFGGVLIMVRPGTAAFDPVALVALLGAFTAGAIAIIIKQLSRTESTTTIVVWFAITGSIVSLIPALTVWVWPTPEQWAWLVGIGVIGIAGQAALTRGFGTGETSFVTPFDYSRLVFATVFGIVLFAEVPDFWKAVGALIIVGSGYYIARREMIAARARAKAKAAENAPS
jgi:drug/metabolite transporter (DMT)-like permease